MRLFTVSIFEKKRNLVGKIIEKVIESEDKLILERKGDYNRIKFNSIILSKLIPNIAKEKTKTNSILLFELRNGLNYKEIKLVLYLRKIDQNDISIRHKLLDIMDKYNLFEYNDKIRESYGDKPVFKDDCFMNIDNMSIDDINQNFSDMFRKKLHEFMEGKLATIEDIFKKHSPIS